MGKKRGSSLEKAIVNAFLKVRSEPFRTQMRRVNGNAKARADFLKAVAVTPAGYKITDPKSGAVKNFNFTKCDIKKNELVCKAPKPPGASIVKLLQEIANRQDRVEKALAGPDEGLAGLRRGRKRKACKGGKVRSRKSGRCVRRKR